MIECIESALIENPYFREDYLGQYRYDPEINEVVLYFKKQIDSLEASVLIEMLADFIIDISQVQTLGHVQSSRESVKTE